LSTGLSAGALKAMTLTGQETSEAHHQPIR
jgi:hypothetical protein